MMYLPPRLDSAHDLASSVRITSRFMLASLEKGLPTILVSDLFTRSLSNVGVYCGKFGFITRTTDGEDY